MCSSQPGTRLVVKQHANRHHPCKLTAFLASEVFTSMVMPLGSYLAFFLQVTYMYVLVLSCFSLESFKLGYIS